MRIRGGVQKIRSLGTAKYMEHDIDTRNTIFVKGTNLSILNMPAFEDVSTRCLGCCGNWQLERNVPCWKVL